MNHYVKILRSAFLAGLCISVGCVVNLRVGGVAGAVLFSFGLLAVLHYKLKLYTGTAGFIRVRGDWSMLVAVLLGNIIACGVCACAMTYAQPDIIAPDMAIVGSRLAKGPLACFLLAIGCGFIMTTAVQFGREGKSSDDQHPVVGYLPDGSPGQFHWVQSVPVVDFKVISLPFGCK